MCESADVLGTDRELAIAAGDLLAILSAGAYAMAMASNYNSRPRPPEVLVDGERMLEIRARESRRVALRRRANARSCDVGPIGIDPIPKRRESHQIVMLDIMTRI